MNIHIGYLLMNIFNINTAVAAVNGKLLQFLSVLRIRIRTRSDPVFFEHPDPDQDPLSSKRPMEL